MWCVVRTFIPDAFLVYYVFKTYLPLIGFLSIEALLPDLGAPLVTGVEILLGDEDPNPTGACPLVHSLCARPLCTEDLWVVCCAPVLIEEDLRTFEPRGESSEFKERLDPALELGLDPPLLPGIPDCLRADAICPSRYWRIDAASSGFIDCLGIGKLRSDFSLIWKGINMVCMCVLNVNMCFCFMLSFKMPCYPKI